MNRIVYSITAKLFTINCKEIKQHLIQDIDGLTKQIILTIIIFQLLKNYRALRKSDILLPSIIHYNSNFRLQTGNLALVKTFQ